MDWHAVWTGPLARLARAGEAGSGAGGKHGVLALGQLQVAVVHGVHPGPQHLADRHSARTCVEALLASVATVGRSVHARVTPEQREIFARRRLRARGHEVLVDHSPTGHGDDQRSEEHTSELQSLAYLVC